MKKKELLDRIERLENETSKLLWRVRVTGASAPPPASPAPELPKRWEDLKEIRGSYIDPRCNIITDDKNYDVEQWNRDVFTTQKEASAALAMAQLSQLMKVYRAGWDPVKGKSRYVIMPNAEDILGVYQVPYIVYLSFETEKLATQFLNNFRDLINQYYML
jgi:hypothetical protein